MSAVLEIKEVVFPLFWVLPCAFVAAWNSSVPPVAALLALSGSWCWMLYFTFMGDLGGAGWSLLLSAAMMAVFWWQVRRIGKLDT